jgi:hypothetical protein
VLKRVVMGLALASSLAGTALPGSAQVGVSVQIGAPPAPLVERIPVAPGPGYFWRPGHWYWNGARYTWVGGAYIVRPAGGAWVAGHWVHGPRRWFWVEGHWR